MAFRYMSMFNLYGAAPVEVSQGLLKRSSVLETWDLYTDPLHPWSKDMPGWRHFNTIGCWQTPGPATLNDTTSYDAYLSSGHLGEDTYAGSTYHARWQIGIIFDRYGNLSQGRTKAGVPACHIIYNQPFFTTNLTNSRPHEDNPESVVTTNSMIGFSLFDSDVVLRYGVVAPNSQWSQVVAQKWELLNSSRVPIAGAVWEARDAYSKSDFTAPTGGWDAHPELWASAFWGNRHAMWPANGSIVRYTMPNHAPCGYIFGRVWHAGQAISAYANDATDHCYMSFPISGSRTITSVVHAGNTYTNSGITSFALLQAAAVSAHKYWFNTASHELWVKLDGTTLYDNSFSNITITSS
jgi:hypothetical protein